MRVVVRRIAIVAGVLTVAALVIWAVMPRAVPIETATVTKGRFVASVDEDGKTRVRERYVVAAPLAGRLSRIRFKVGDQIQVDDAVATITPSPAPLMDPRTRREVEERLGAHLADPADDARNHRPGAEEGGARRPVRFQQGRLHRLVSRQARAR